MREAPGQGNHGPVEEEKLAQELAEQAKKDQRLIEDPEPIEDPEEGKKED
jgi:hypothetical protein